MATTQRKGTVHPAARPRAVALAIATAFLPWYLPQTAHAQAPDPNTLPTGGQITNGAGQIHAVQGTHLQIDQYTQKMIAEFGSFSIGANASVNLSQPGASSIALFRDVGGDPSKIFGNLTANGQLFISNQNGVLFGASARVDVGALFATSLSITDHDFMAGRYHWYNEGNAGSVVNQGQIVTANGYTALVGPQVRNDGIIIARAGSVALAAGDRVSLDLIGDGLISVSVDQSAYNASVVNSGSITADGGTVLLTARSANALLDTVINNSGTIRANSLVERNGQIVLDGGNTGVVSVTGTLQAAGLEAGTTGGTIKVLGDKVGLFGSAVVDASGDAGGGTVLIGGNFQGKGPEANASRAYVGTGVRISADAISEGDGGEVIVWADEITRFYGTLTARGGNQSGNGGFAEISGKGSLDFRGNVDLSAANGAAGTVLFDPLNITISTAADANTAGFTVVGDQTEAFADDGGLSSNFDVTAGTGSFAGVATGTTIELQAENDITLQTNFNLDTATGNTGVNLTLRAGNNIDLGTGFTITSSGGDISATANDNGGGTASGAGSILGDANIVTSGVAGGAAGSVTLSTAGSSTGTISVGNITATGGNGAANAVGGNGGAVSLTAVDGNVTVGAIQTSGGNAGAADAGGQFAGGNAGSVTLQVSGATASRAISVGAITSTGGTGSTATTVDGAGGVGGLGGGTTVTATVGSGASLSASSITTTGGTGGASLGATTGGTGGNGGGAIVSVSQAATISGAITTSGGTGGASGATGTAGNGGNAAAVSVTSTTANVSVADITATGGAAGAPNGGTVGTPGTAASATIAAATNVLLNASINVGTSTVSFSFGQGGAGGVLTLPSTTNITASAISATGGGGSDTIVVTRDADMTLSDASLAVSGAYTLGLASVEVANLTGGAADNSFTVSGWSGTGTLDGAGGTGDSIVAVNDVATIDLTSTSLARATLGTLTLANIEVADLTGGAGVNAFTVSSWTGSATLRGDANNDSYAVSLTGAGSGSVTAVDTSGTDTVTVNGTAGVDAFTLTDSTVTLGTETVNYTSADIETLAVNGMASNDSFTVSNLTRSATLDGGAGTADAIVATNDVDFTLTNTSLARSGGQATLTLANIEVANLTGGGSANTFTVSGWSGTGTLDGLLGADTVVAVNDVADFTLTNASLARTALGTLTLSGIEVANLTGGGSANTFTVSGWTGTGTLDGLLGSDTVVAVNDVATIALTNTTLDRAGMGQLTLAGIEVADLTGGAGTNSFTVSNWTGSATLTGLGADDGYSITFNGTAGSVTVVDAAGAADSITVNGTAGADAFTLTNSAVSTAAETVNYTSADIETLAVNGLAGDDTFTVSALTRAATVDGGLNSDTIIATNDVANFALTNTTLDRTGTTQLTLAGMEVANLTGGGSANAFTVSGWSGTGTLDGLAGSDTITATNDADFTLTDTSLARTALGTLTLASIEVANLTGGGSANTFTLSGWTGSAAVTGGGGADTLVGPNATNSWTIDGAGDGNINGAVAFIDISHLTGGTTADTFTFTTGSLAGNIDGGTGTNSINIAAVAGANTINLQAGTVSTVLGGTFTNVTSFTGDNTADTLVGTNANTAWTISGANDGSLSTGQTFTDIPSLTGGTLDDTFTLTSGTLSGSINGAGGNDTLSGSTTYVVTGGNSGTATGVTGGFSSIENLVGTAGADTFTLSGGTLAGTVDGLAGTDTLTGDNVANTWTITGPNSGTLTGTGGWLNIENLVGGTGTDSFSGILAGSVGGTISDGGGGATTLSGTINSSGSQTYSAAVSSAGVTLNAGTAAISATNAANNFTGQLSVTGSSASITDANALTIGANLTGGLTTSSGALTYVAGTSVGSLSSTASGAVNQTGGITVSGATSINAGGNAITLTSVNDFQGTLSLIGGTTQIRDANALTLGNVSVGALTTINTGALNLGTLNASALSATTNGGNITQSAPASVTGATNLQAGSGSIMLALANDFGGAVAASGIGITLNDVNTLTPGTINAGSGSVNLSANSIGAGGTVSAGAASSFSSNTNVNGLDINMPNVPLALSGAATQWNLKSTPTTIAQPNPVTVPGANVGVTYNLASIIASVAQQQAASASSSVSATVAAVIVEEANKTFGTDSVAEDVEYGFAGEVGTTPPMDHRIDESGISLPRCVQESREGMPCK